jgi:hypothetical protein
MSKGKPFSQKTSKSKRPASGEDGGEESTDFRWGVFRGELSELVI